jgi:hypothetical protein
MSGFEEVTDGFAGVAEAFGLGAGQGQIEGKVEVPEGVARMQLYPQRNWEDPVPVPKGSHCRNYLARLLARPLANLSRLDAELPPDGLP